MSNTAKEKKYYLGIGRRKTAVAKVRIFEGCGKNLINNKEISLTLIMKSPLELVGKTGKFYVHVLINGGGNTSRQEAIRLGISRALEKYDESFRTSLKKAGMLKRDPREKERKKPGLKKARRSPQWSKR